MRKIGFIGSILMIVLCFAGCRPSPVLEQIIYTQNATDVDPEESKIEAETQAQETEQLAMVTQEQADEKKDTNDEAGTEDSQADSEHDSKKLDYDKKADSKGTAKNKDGGGSGKHGTGKGKHSNSEAKKSEKSETKESKEQGSKKKEDSKKETKKTTKEKTTEQAEEETTLEELQEIDETEESESVVETKEDTGEVEGDSDDSGNPDETQAEEETQEIPKKVVTNGQGEEQEIPEDVQSVTAVGSIASIVEMLGGSNRLIGSSDSFTSSSLVSTLCEDVASGSVQTWWSGDGKESISDSDFQALLEAKPEVCFEVSGDNTFTSSQIQQLEEAGISYMVLPELNSVQNLKDAVTIVAEVLDENSDSGKDATKIAKKYSNWVDETLSTVESKTSDVALASLYITEWRDDISYQLTENYESLPSEAGLTNGKGSGVAIAWSPKKDELMTTWMATAGVTNTSTSNGSLADTEGSYVMPMAHQFSVKFSSSEYTYYTQNMAAGADWFVAQKVSDSSYNLLGSDAFPAIIVANSEIKTAIENNWFWQYWGDLENSAWGFGYTSEDGTSYYSSIGGDYDIYVSPTGIESWADGCVESPLEAYWVACKISGKISESTLKSKVKAFYKEFFDVTLSDSQLEQIINQ